MITLIGDYFEYNMLVAIQNGEYVTESAALGNDLRQGLIGIISFILYVISGITFLQWFKRAYYNLHQRDTICAHSVGWSVGSWFVPIISLYRPYNIMKEMWTETLNFIQKKVPEYISSTKVAVVGWWWALWIFSSVIANAFLRGTFKAETISDYIFSSVTDMVICLIGIPLAIITVKMIKEYSAMEQLLLEKEIEENKELAKEPVSINY